MPDAEIIDIPTTLMGKYRDDNESEERSKFEHYESELLIKLQLSEGLVRDIFDLHYSDEYKGCMECSTVADDYYAWPCRTARKLGAELGIEEPEGYMKESETICDLEDEPPIPPTPEGVA